MSGTVSTVVHIESDIVTVFCLVLGFVYYRIVPCLEARSSRDKVTY